MSFTLFKIKSLFLVLFFSLAFPIAPETFAQSDAEEISNPSVKKKKRRRKRRKRRRPKSTKDLTEGNLKDDANAMAAEAGENAVKEEVESMLFPDWGSPSFDWYLSPIIGLRYTKDTGSAGTTDTIASEIGLSLGLKGIPVIPMNPGLFISPSVGKAWGSLDSKLSGMETQSVKYQRTFGSLAFIVPVHWYRHTLKLTRGVKEYSVDSYSKWQSFSVMNDFAVLVLPVFSTHFTHTYRKAFQDKMDDPNVLENDYWLHGRFSTSILKFYIDAGPGFTKTKEYAFINGSHEEVADGQVDYFKLLTGMHLFWKFGMSGTAKYIYNATDNNLGQYAGQLLPEEGLSQPREQTMPEDSLSASLFIGARNIVAGFGFGWQYNLLILNMNKKGGREKKTTKDQGYTLTYDVSF